MLAIIYSIYIKNRGLNVSTGKTIPVFLLCLLSFYFGTFPYGAYDDRSVYVEIFRSSTSLELSTDALFSIYNYFCHSLLSIDQWLILTGFLYVFGYYKFSINTFGDYAAIFFVGYITFCFFNGYGVNTMRAGLASSLFIYGLTWLEKNKKICFVLLVGSVCIHSSFGLPVLAFIVSNFYPKSKLFFLFWLFSIPLSIVGGKMFQIMLAPLMSEFSGRESTVSSYFLEETDRYKSGFRFDFLFYSVIPALLSYYYIFVKEVKDELYINVFNVYLVTNTIWILVIRANFSDRFGYLSWFLIPILLFYPPLKYNIWNKQHQKVALILFLHALFTFVIAIR